MSSSSQSSEDDSEVESVLNEEESEEEEDGDKVAPEKLQQLGEWATRVEKEAVSTFYFTACSERLKDMLHNRHLRRLLLEVDRSPDPTRTLRQAMQIQIFVEFADECLRVCGLREEEEHAHS